MEISTYVDEYNAVNLETWGYHTGILFYLNHLLIIWFSKRKNAIESSSLGSKFLAFFTYFLVSLRYKLMMFFIPIHRPEGLFCENQSVTNNVTLPDSVLKNRHNEICYHRFR